MFRVCFYFLAVFLFIISQTVSFSRRYTAELKYDNKKSNSEQMIEYQNKSFPECSWLCRNDCGFFGYNEELRKCRTHRRIYTSNIFDEKGWRHFTVDLENLALGKGISYSSIWPTSTTSECVVGGLLCSKYVYTFHSDFELYPWLTIALGFTSVVNNVVLYNRNDNHGHWLHSVEVRVGMSSSWSEMKVCGTFDGPSQTGQIHTTKCVTEPALYGSYVTVKIVRPNHITVEENPYASGGKNGLILRKVEVYGYYA